MSDATNHDNMRELEDAGLAGYAAGHADDAAAPPPGADPAPVVDPLRPYSSEELAQLTAALTTMGVPADRMGAYQAQVLARTRPGFELLGIGDALAEYGVGHGGGIDAMPAWARLLAGAAVVGFTVVATRREFTEAPKDDAAAEEAGA